MSSLFLDHGLYGVATLFRNMHIVRNHIFFCWNCQTFDIVEETEQKTEIRSFYVNINLKPKNRL